MTTLAFRAILRLDEIGCILNRDEKSVQIRGGGSRLVVSESLKLDQDLVAAAKKGRLQRLDMATLKARLAASKARVISIRVPVREDRSR